MAPNWQINVLRFTLFSTRDAAAIVDVWGAMLGSAPDIEEARPRDGTRREAGAYRDGYLEITSGVGRLDIAISPRAPEPQEAWAFNQFAPANASRVKLAGDFVEELDAVAETVAAWLPKCPWGIYRLAVAGVGLVPTATAVDAHTVLKDQIRTFEVSPGQMKELVYRVNWPVDADDKNIGFYNRVTGWSTVALSMPGDLFGRAGVLEEHFASFDFDINTPGDRGSPLAQAQWVPTLNALVALAQENLKAGECPLC